MYMIKVLLADDQELIRESLGFVLGAQGDITVVGMAKNGREAIELVRSEKPDVVLMDIRMPEVDGVECTRLIKSAHPNIKVIRADDVRPMTSMCSMPCGSARRAISSRAFRWPI